MKKLEPVFWGLFAVSRIQSNLFSQIFSQIYLVIYSEDLNNVLVRYSDHGMVRYSSHGQIKSWLFWSWFLVTRLRGCKII